MSENVHNFDKEEVRHRIKELIALTQSETQKLGIKTVIVGSLGIAGLSHKYPQLYRGVDPKTNKFKCVDIDVLIGLPKGLSHQLVKDCFDSLWMKGMDSQYQIPVSPVNLPRDVANDPNAVLGFEWTLGKPVTYSNRGGKSTMLPADFPQLCKVEIFGQKADTLTPKSQLLFKIIARKRPLHIMKDINQLTSLLGKTYQFPPILSNES